MTDPTLQLPVIQAKNFQGYVCQHDGTNVPLADCIACSQTGGLPGCNVTTSILTGIAAGLRSEDHSLSVTTLLSCPRKRYLMQRSPYFLDPLKAWPAFRGQLAHKLLEDFTPPDVIKEQRFHMLVDGLFGSVEITGQPDLIDAQRGHLVDYKSTNWLPTAPKEYRCPNTDQVLPDPKDRKRRIGCDCADSSHLKADIRTLGAIQPRWEHTAQLSLYRALLAENGIQIETGEIVYFTMKETLRLPVDFWDIDSTWAFIRSKVIEFTHPQLPARVPEDKRWLCDWCPVQQVCLIS